MQPVKLTIEGDFWDVQLYSGRLHLFERDGSITTVNWDKLVEALSGDADTRLVTECALRRGDYLYASDLELFFRDSSIRKLITEKFASLSRKIFAFTRREIDRFVIGRQINPYPFPHADCTIYRNKLWVVGMDGVFSGSCNRRTKYPLGTRVIKSWDSPVFSTTASYGALALAAGSEGLWEHDLDRYNSFYIGEPHQIVRNECDSCDWMYYNIYGKSYEGGFLAEFQRREGDFHRQEREFSSTIFDQDIFDHPGYSWGTRDKIYMASHGQLDIVRYSPFRDEKLTHLGRYSIEKWKGNLVSGGVAPFGTIVEYDYALVVLPSSGDPITLKGEPVRWRVYPRAKYYQNHLHVIYEDKIEILSFNHDYFVNQSAKIFGSNVILTVR